MGFSLSAWLVRQALGARGMRGQIYFITIPKVLETIFLTKKSLDEDLFDRLGKPETDAVAP